jgi:hypothetical protein
MIRTPHFHTALAVYEKRIESALDIRLHVARNINVTKWVDSSLCLESYKISSIEIEFEGNGTDRVGDLYIVKTKRDAYYAVWGELNYALFNYTEGHDILSRYMIMGTDVSLPGRIRYADLMLLTSEMKELVVFEIDCQGRSLSNVQAFCLEYFGLMPHLRAVVLMKVMRRRAEDYEVAMVGVLYRRGANGPMIADAVSFGHRPLSAMDAIPGNLAPLLRYLPVASYTSRTSPWTPAQRPHITIPAEDLSYVDAHSRRRKYRNAPADLVIDLWSVLKRILVGNYGPFLEQMQKEELEEWTDE